MKKAIVFDFDVKTDFIKQLCAYGYKTEKLYTSVIVLIMSMWLKVDAILFVFIMKILIIKTKYL